MNKLFKFIATVIICEGVGLMSTPFTIAAIPTWFVTLNKPFFSPPNWIFAPVWTVLYFMMGVAAYLILERGLRKTNVKNALTFFGIQLFLNFIWSLLFFGLHSPLLGFIDIIFLLAFIIITTKKFYRISNTAGLLMIPYIFWVSFATILNFAILILNR